MNLRGLACASDFVIMTPFDGSAAVLLAALCRGRHDIPASSSLTPTLCMSSFTHYKMWSFLAALLSTCFVEHTCDASSALVHLSFASLCLQTLLSHITKSHEHNVNLPFTNQRWHSPHRLHPASTVLLLLSFIFSAQHSSISPCYLPSASFSHYRFKHHNPQRFLADR